MITATKFCKSVQGLTLVYYALFIWLFITVTSHFVLWGQYFNQSELLCKYRYWMDQKFKMNTIFYEVHKWIWPRNKACDINFYNYKLNKSIFASLVLLYHIFNIENSHGCDHMAIGGVAYNEVYLSYGFFFIVKWAICQLYQDDEVFFVPHP